MDRKNSLLALLGEGVDDMLIQEARRKHPDSARQLLNQAIHLMQAGEPLPHNVSLWLADCLSQVLEEAPNAGHAFGLVNSAGNPGKHSVEFQELLADIHHEKTGGTRGTFSEGCNRKGESYALTATAELFGVDARTAKEYYKNNIETVLERRRIGDELRDENEEQ